MILVTCRSNHLLHFSLKMSQALSKLNSSQNDAPSIPVEGQGISQP